MSSDPSILAVLERLILDACHEASEEADEYCSDKMAAAAARKVLTVLEPPQAVVPRLLAEIFQLKAEHKALETNWSAKLTALEAEIADWYLRSDVRGLQVDGLLRAREIMKEQKR